jgi:hypothetical protein
MGNKPYSKVSLNELIDRFPNIFRCNMSLPNRNNGTIYGKLGLCNHLYQNLIQKKISKEQFHKEYDTYKPEEIDFFFENFDPPSYDEIFLVDADTQKVQNRRLGQIGCPFRFSRLPRTGYTIILNNIIDKPDEKVFVSNFSIRKEQRRTYYVLDGKEESGFHVMDDEIKILRWLHENNRVDATLCFMEDIEGEIVLNCGGLRPSKFICEMIEETFKPKKIRYEKTVKPFKSKHIHIIK